VRDLRILPFCVAALSDSGIGYVVESDLLPKLGKLVVPELLATLRIEKGKALDAKKLRVLVAIQQKEAQPLVIQAAEKGSPELRGAAIAELAELDPAAAEPIALKMLANDRADDVKRAAVSALSGATSDEALDALFKVFTGTERLRSHAGVSLAQLSHPKTTERAVTLLTPALLSMTPYKMPKGLSGAKKAAAEKEERAHHGEVGYLGEILDLLASRKDKDTSATVLDIFRKHKVKEVRGAAARALLKSGYEGAFDELAPSVVEADWETRSEFIEHIFKVDPTRAFDRLSRFLDPANLKTANHTSLAEHILDHIEGESDSADEPEDEDEAAAMEEHEGEGAGPRRSFLDKDGRWVDAAIALLAKEELTNSALDVIAKVKSPKALDAVLKMASGKIKSHHAWRMLQVLTEHKDPRVPPMLLRFLDVLQGYWGRRAAYRAMRTYDDAAIGPALKGWAAGKKRLEKRDKDEIEDLIQFLERDRALTAGV
jgi:HEAT repeat protein